jgi:diaminohydroxyphosphoribosylaminopyrimidine deaminase/5-amino-6-(5-phosphoribosylamino)uracil reductase
MREALELGRYALGRSSPNPSVGAVIVDNDGVAGRGWSQPVGGSHAEIVALKEAGSRAQGATLYVTLEPCCHQGRTPPCVDAILQAGLARCVVATIDPFPSVRGKGIERLRAGGIVVDMGVCGPEAGELHAGFFTRVRTGPPLVRAKYAMTLDGRIATRTGESQWITGQAARRQAHIFRDRTDAVLVGAGTVSADNPTLTTPLPDEFTGDGGSHHPLRIVVDGKGSTSPDANVYSPHLPGRTLVATTEAADLAWINGLAKRELEHIVCGEGPLVDLEYLLDELGTRGLDEILVEGGSRLLGAFFDAGLIDRVAAFVAPLVVGGAAAPGPVGGRGCESMAEAQRLSDVRLTVLDEDVLLEGALPSPRAREDVA